VRALIVGWFSFEEMGATAGDLLVRDVVCGWLDDAGCPYDMAVAPPFAGGVDLHKVDPEGYTHLIFTCGPFGNGWPITDLLSRFAGRRLVGVDLSMLQPLEEWDPFDLLLERDSNRTVRPDLAFSSRSRSLPLVGLVRVHDQREYGDRGAHAHVHEMFEQLLTREDFAVVNIDTRLDTNATGMRTPEDIEALIARTDVVVTTRLHGLVLALKNGIPALAVDPIRGGAKITRQAQAISWPWCFEPTVELPALRVALRDCLTDEARRRAANVAQRARASLDETREAFMTYIRPRNSPS
jgi:hypothetical protein